VKLLRLNEKRLKDLY